MMDSARDDGDMRKFRIRKMLVDLHRDMAGQAFRWAEFRRQDPMVAFPKAASREEATEYVQRYMEGLPNTAYGAQFPGRLTILINRAFANMGQSAEEWEEWGNRLTAAHDQLLALFEAEYGPQATAAT